MIRNNREVGYIFEERTIEFLKKNNYEILEQNLYSPYGEIDIIVKKGEQIIAIEVKYRNNPMISIFETIPYDKIERIRKSLLWYMQKKNYLNKFILTIDAFLIEEKNGKITTFLVENIQLNY